ncbi:MAG: type II toxin-antitoxin system PemK/MazF family toxin [Bacillota bacterium]
MSIKEQFRSKLWATRDYKQGEIYLVADEKVIMPDGQREYHKSRPVVILSEHPLNRTPLYPLILVAPLSTRVDVKQSCDLLLKADVDGVERDCLLKLNLSQPFLKVDLSREPVGCLSQEAIERMLALMLDLLGIDTSQ